MKNNPLNRRLRQVIVALLVTVILGLVGAAVSACPNCKNSIPEAGDLAGARMREGYFWSYVIMSSVPFISLGIITTLLFSAKRKQALARQMRSASPFR